ncbi:MAG: hypothetical protein ACYS9X_28785 [Planctomycetota bacterium]|jgi:hypothetical protein
MLAESGVADLLIIAIIVAAVIIRSVVEYFRKQKAEQEAKERKLRGARAEGGERGAARAEPEARPAAGGLQALLDALQGRESGEEPPRAPEPAEKRGEVWDVAGERAMDPATLEHERARAAEAAAAARRAQARPSPAALSTLEEEPEAGAELPTEAVAPPSGARAPALAAVGLLAGPGGPPLRDQARRGVLWSVVLGPPRGTVPYGERGASEAPGGVV